MSSNSTTRPFADDTSAVFDRAPAGKTVVEPAFSHASTGSVRSQYTAGMGPVQPMERYELIDVIRGFALFGVLIANLTVVTFYGTTREMLLEMPTGDYELLAASLLRYFVRGKFIFLFSLLFGLGLALQMERAAARGKALGSIYLRRLAVLLMIGVVHGVFLWWGDILHIYALAGFVLFLLRYRSDRFLLICGSLLAILPMTIFWCLPAIQAQLGVDATAGASPRSTLVAERIAALTDGGYAAVIQDNLQNYLRNHYRWLIVTIAFYAAGVFMLGFVVGRRRLLQEAPRHRKTFQRLLRWGLLIGLPGGLLYTFARTVDVASPWAVPFRLPIQVSLLALGVAYLASIVLLYQRPWARPTLSLLAPVGRMALSNYLAHSVCYVLLFSGIGLGLVGKIGNVLGVLIAITIFLAQIVVSQLWFGRFRFGPAEWLWRKLTYGSRPRFVSSEEPVATVETTSAV